MSKPITTLADLQPDTKNANKGTPRGRDLIERSLHQYGAGRSVLADRNGKLIAGNKTVDAASAIGLEDVIVVQSDGTKVVVVQRTDLDLDEDTAARELALVDNRAGEVSLDWDTAVLAELGESIDLSQWWTKEELIDLAIADPEFAPVGIEEQGRLDEKAKVTCPECGHEFVPKT